MGITERKQREKERRRRAIMEAAKEVFFSKGLPASTMDEIAEKAELSKGTLYLYFDSKEALYLSLVDEGLGVLVDMFREVVSEDLPGDGLLRKIGRTYYAFYRTHRNYFKILFFSEHCELHRKVAQKKGNLFAPEKGIECLKMVAGAVQKGMDEGFFRDDLNAMEIANILWANSNGIIHLMESEQAHLGEEMGIDFEKLLYKSWELILSAIRVR
jgi:AcrR family transcriptional regulator